MGRFWCVLFLLVPVLGVAAFLAAPVYNHWLPEDWSANGRRIDQLWYFILYLTGAVFVATEIVLFWFMWKYDADKNNKPAEFTHGSHNLEVIWTLLPAATLLFIAIMQMSAWEEAKMEKPHLPALARVTARQFEWRIQYPGPDGKLGTPDDLFAVNDLAVPVNEEVIIDLESMDVLHSFFLPNMRVKQDAVPGSVIPVWFKPTRVGEYDIVCAELCGWGHYKMKGRLLVLSRPEYEQWLENLRIQQEATQ